MHKLYELKEKLLNELEGYSQNGKFSKEDVEVIKYMTSAVDHLCNIIMDMEDEEYSNAGSYEDGMSMVRGRGSSRAGGRSYRGNSYARERSGARRRDSMGRYSRSGDDFMMDFEDLINDAPNEHIKKKMQAIMSEM